MTSEYKVKAPILESRRIYLEPLTSNHLSQKYVDWLNDPEVNKYLDSGGDYTIEKLKYFLQDVEQKDVLFWAIHLKTSKQHIGNIKIDPIISKYGLCEYGILIGEKSAWGKGYAQEASEIVINYCFDQLNLRKMTLGVVEKNINAIKLYTNLGFSIEGVFIDHGRFGGQYCNTVRMALFNRNYIDK